MSYQDYTPATLTDTDLSDQQFQALAMDECNLTDGSALGTLITTSVQLNCPVWWSLYAFKGQIIAFWYVKRAIIDYLIARYRGRRDVKLGSDSYKNSDLIKTLSLMREAVQTELDKLDPEDDGIVTSIDPGNCLPNVIEEHLERIEAGWEGDYPWYDSYQP